MWTVKFIDPLELDSLKKWDYEAGCQVSLDQLWIIYKFERSENY